MSTDGFNRLFAGYPDNEKTRRLRKTVQIVIEDALARMRPAKLLIRSATRHNQRDTLYMVIKVAENVWADLRKAGAPLRAVEDVAEILGQARQARQAWNGVDANRRCVLALRRGHRATPEQFEAVKAAYVKVINDLTDWLSEAYPGASS